MKEKPSEFTRWEASEGFKLLREGLESGLIFNNFCRKKFVEN